MAALSMPGEMLSRPLMVNPCPTPPICSAVVAWLVTRIVPRAAAGLVGGEIVVAARPFRDSSVTFLLMVTSSL